MYRRKLSFLKFLKAGPWSLNVKIMQKYWIGLKYWSVNKLFDLYNPRGIHKSHLTQENKPYFLLIKKVWRITPFGEVRE